MTFLPIVERELRVAARRKQTYSARLTAAIVAAIFGGYSFWMYSAMGGRGGRALFTTLTYLAFFYCLMAGLRNASDCISEEKREGTLGLLFLTDLKGYDIVFGKLIATGINSLYGLLAAYPILGTALLVGGVSGLEFWRVILALLNAFFFSHAAALVISTFSRHSRKSFVGALVLVGIFLIGFPLLSEAIKSDYPGSPLIRPLLLLSPWNSFAMATTIGLRLSYFWTSLLLTNLLGWVFLAIASFSLPHVWQDKAASMRALRWREGRHKWYYGKAEKRRAFRERLLAVNPFFWLVSRDRLKSTYLWSFLAVIYCVFVWIWIKYTGWTWKEPFFIITILITHTVFKVWLASEASHHFEEQRHSGSLEMLLACTPLDVPEILRGQWMALRRIFVEPIVAILAIDAAMLWIGHSGNRKIDDKTTYAIGAAMVTLVIDAIALAWVAMWFGLSSKPKRAAGRTVALILFLPWVLFYVGGTAMAALTMFVRVRWDFSVYLAIWFGLGLVIDLVFAISARYHLRKDFREFAAAHSSAQLGLTGRLGGWLGKILGSIWRRSNRNTNVPPVILNR